MAKEPFHGIARKRMGGASAPEQEQVALLAYAKWQKRGSPDGSPEVDWFAAERELANRKSASGGQLRRVMK